MPETGDDESRRDEILRRMLKAPPAPKSASGKSTQMLDPDGNPPNTEGVPTSYSAPRRQPRS